MLHGISQRVSFSALNRRCLISNAILMKLNVDEEITFNYKFPLAVKGEERIKCLCGTKNCVGFLN